MGILLKLIGAAMAGFGSHRFYGPTKSLGPRLGSMIRYAIGVITVYPFAHSLHNELHQGRRDGDSDASFTSAWFLSFMAVACGVFVGHLADQMFGSGEKND